MGAPILSEELLSRIFAHLERSALLNLSPVSRAFARISTPYLYRDCNLLNEYLPQRTRQTTCFLRTLLENPVLAKFVEDISLSYVYEERFGPGMGPHNEDIQVFMGDVAQRGVPSLSRILGAGVWTDIQDGIGACILCLLPNLNSLALNMERCRSRNDAMAIQWCALFAAMRVRGVVEHAALPVPLDQHNVLSNLTEARILDDWLLEDDEDPGYNVCVISVFMHIPSLRRLTCVGCQDIEPRKEWMCAEGGSNVKELMFYHCEVGPGTLQQATISCRALETFECLRKCMACYRGAFGDQQWHSGFVPELKRHAQSLTRLRMHNIINCCGSPKPQIDDPILSFTPFASLRFLKIDKDYLYGEQYYDCLSIAAILPSSLEHVIFV